MSSGLKADARVCGTAILVVAPLIAATLLIQPGFPYLLERVLFCAWGVAGTLGAHRLLFSRSFSTTAREVGFVRSHTPMLMAVLLISLPMWAFLPVFAWASGVTVTLRPDWPRLLLGVVPLVSFPLAFVFERGGNSLAGPAILHTSSNAPIMILAMPDDFMATVVLPHMAVVLVALYLVFVIHRFAADKERATAAPLRAV